MMYKQINENLLYSTGSSVFCDYLNGKEIPKRVNPRDFLGGKVYENPPALAEA